MSAVLGKCCIIYFVTRTVPQPSPPLPLSCAALTPLASAHCQTHSDPSPCHCPQPGCWQHQKHRPYNQINNYAILSIFIPGQIPAIVGSATIDYIQEPAIKLIITIKCNKFRSHPAPTISRESRNTLTERYRSPELLAIVFTLLLTTDAYC